MTRRTVVALAAGLVPAGVTGCATPDRRTRTGRMSDVGTSPARPFGIVVSAPEESP